MRIMSSLTNKSQILFWLIVLPVTLAVAFLGACTKDLTPLGLNLVSESQMLQMGYSDTATIQAFTVAEDSLYSKSLKSGSTYLAFVGKINDPVFGTTEAKYFSQIKTTTNSVSFGSNPVFDSAYLYLPLLGASYGDTLTNMTFTIYELSESIIDSVHTYSNNSIPYDQTHPLGSITLQPKPHDSLYYNGYAHAPGLRIPINSNFGNKIVNISDTTTLSTPTEFVKYFKGICVVAQPQNPGSTGCVMVFNVANDESRLLMYYHNAEDTTTYTFGLNTSCLNFNRYNHDGHAAAIPQLREQLAGNTSLGNEFLFVQGFSGTKVKIKIPYLQSWFKSGKIAINDAQLIVHNASSTSAFPPPSYLTLRVVGETGSTSPFSLVDDGDAQALFDGGYNSDAATYRFNLKRYVQQVMSGNLDDRNGLYLFIPSGALNGNRLVLHGPGSTASDVKLYLRFTKVN